VALKTQDSDELLIFTGELQEKIRAADLAGLKDLEPRTPEEEEQQEESEGEDMPSFSGDEGPQAGRTGVRVRRESAGRRT